MLRYDGVLYIRLTINIFFIYSNIYESSLGSHKDGLYTSGGVQTPWPPNHYGIVLLLSIHMLSNIWGSVTWLVSYV